MIHHLKTNIQQHIFFQHVPLRSLTLLCPQSDELEEESSTRLSSPNSYNVATKNQTCPNLALNSFLPPTESKTILSLTTSSSGVIIYNFKCTHDPYQSSTIKRCILNELEEDGITRPSSPNSNNAYIKSKNNKTKINRVLNSSPTIAMMLPINKPQYPRHSLLSRFSNYNPLGKNNKNKKDNSESNSTNIHHPNQHHSKLTNRDNNRQNTNTSRRHLCTNEFFKGN